MKATCSQENLARGLAVVNRAVATRTTLPILSNILVETDNSRLKLSATNLEIGISCWVPARIEVEGATTVPARLLSEFVNSLPAEQIALELDGRSQTLSIAADRYSAEIKGIDAADFPILPSVEQGLRFSLDTETLKDMIGQVTFAAATDESRPPLMGVLTVLDPDSGQITMAAADGFRLSVRRAGLDVPLDEKVTVIIPARALLELGRIATGDDDRIDVAITENRNQILFRMSSVDLVSQLIDGAFPDYERVVPPGYETRIVVQSKAMHNAVRIASFFARDTANIVRLDVHPSDPASPGTLVISAQSAEIGANQTEIEASVTGPPVQVSFNAKFLMEVVDAVGSDQVAVEFATSTSAGVFRPVNDVDFVHVVMPMHVGP